MKRADLEIVTKGDIQRLSRALALSAKQGVNSLAIQDTITDLMVWLRSGNTDFVEWNRLTETAANTWAKWYDWYSGILTRPMVSLDGETTRDWYEATQLNWEDRG